MKIFGKDFQLILSSKSQGELIICFELDAAVMDYPWTMAEWLEARGPSYVLFMISIDSEIVGFVLFNEHQDSWHLLKIALREESQGRGIARRALESFFKDYNPYKHRCYLEVRSINQAAISLYNRLGFRQIHYQAGYYSDGADCVKMLRDSSFS